MHACMQVVSAVGASDSDLKDLGAPKRIDGVGAIALVEAAAALGVEQFVMVTSLGTGKFGWPAGAPFSICGCEPGDVHAPRGES